MGEMIPCFDVDLKQPGNAAFFEKTTREAWEKLELNGHSQRAPSEGCPPPVH
jgi:hypothetical protein